GHERDGPGIDPPRRTQRRWAQRGGLSAVGSARWAQRGGLSAVGEFVMEMHNEFGGDHRVENQVVVLEPNRASGWAPAEPAPGPCRPLSLTRVGAPADRGARTAREMSCHSTV